MPDPSYGGALAALLGGGGGAAPAPAGPPASMRPPNGSALGAPSPTGVGAVPTGMGSVPSKVALATSIMYLREVKNQFPQAANNIDGWIAQLTSMSNAGAPGALNPAVGGAVAPPVPPQGNVAPNSNVPAPG